MVREKHIRLSDDEHRHLSEYRREKYGTDEIPFGVVVSDLLEQADADE